MSIQYSTQECKKIILKCNKCKKTIGIMKEKDDKQFSLNFINTAVETDPPIVSKMKFESKDRELLMICPECALMG